MTLELARANLTAARDAYNRYHAECATTATASDLDHLRRLWVAVSDAMDTVHILAHYGE